MAAAGDARHTCPRTPGSAEPYPPAVPQLLGDLRLGLQGTPQGDRQDAGAYATDAVAGGPAMKNLRDRSVCRGAQPTDRPPSKDVTSPTVARNQPSGGSR